MQGGDAARDGASPIAAFLNPGAGKADDVAAALEATGAFAVHRVEPQRMDGAVRAALPGASRLVAAGGDGTVGAVAAVVAGTRVALAVVPAGTLNHFARDHDIPVEPAEAAQLARDGQARPVDVARVNGRLFLNTSSIGAYVRFVRWRERLEPRLGYHLASAVAAFRALVQLRTYLVRLTVEGRERSYHTPLVFIGVGERELRVPKLGGRVPDGARALHVLVVRGGPLRRIVALVAVALARGVHTASGARWIDAMLVDACSVELPGGHNDVAVDGEIVSLDTPLEYAMERDALLLVCPPPGEPAKGEGGQSGA